MALGGLGADLAVELATLGIDKIASGTGSVAYSIKQYRL
jgi:hypothetical protein